MLKIFEFDFFTPLSGNLKTLHFDANFIKIGYPLSYEQFMNAQNNVKHKDLISFFADIKNKNCDIRPISPDQSCHKSVVYT